MRSDSAVRESNSAFSLMRLMTTYEHAGHRDGPAALPAPPRAHRPRHPRERRPAVGIDPIHEVEGRCDEQHRHEPCEQDAGRGHADERDDRADDGRQRVRRRGRVQADDEGVDEADGIVRQLPPPACAGRPCHLRRGPPRGRYGTGPPDVNAAAPPRGPMNSRGCGSLYRIRKSADNCHTSFPGSRGAPSGHSTPTTTHIARSGTRWSTAGRR